MHDLIVAGAGPIGCYLAKEFADRDLDVLVLEEHEKIGKSVACSGHISNLLWNFIPRNENIIENEIHGAKFHIKNDVYTFGKKRTHSCVVDREGFDKYMAKLAREAGAEILTSHKVSDIFNTDSHVTVYAKNDGTLKNFQGKMLAGCDGVNSKVRRSMDLRQMKTIHGLFCYVNEGSNGDYVDVYPSKTKDFFAWKIPRGKVVEYGLASKYSEDNYRNLLSFLEEFNLKEGDVEEFHSGNIPLSFLKKLSSKRMFLAGDSGGTVKPFTGGGIIYGLTSAKLASELISTETPNSLKKYEGVVNRVLKQDIMAGKLIKKFYKLPPLIQNSFLNIMNKKIGNFHMDKPSKIFMNIIKN